ncbi:MAG: diacylglycerol kinase family protein [Candidatus Paceibacterota bacterium]|jgi:diacylglycerol kinase (ATP)
MYQAPKLSFFPRLVRSFCDAFRGLLYVWKEEQNFRIQACIAICAIASLFLLQFTYIEISLAIFSIVLVLASEVINTTFEDILNKVEPNHDPAIGRIKDIAAGVVVLNVIGAFLVASSVIIHHFF